MKKLLGIVVLSLLLSGNVFADNHIITIQCKHDDPNLSFLKPIYVINLETKKVKVGATSMHVVKHDENKIILGKVNAALSEIMKIDRITGLYEKDQTFYGSSKEDEKKIKSSGICQKVEKAF